MIGEWCNLVIDGVVALKPIGYTTAYRYHIITVCGQNTSANLRAIATTTDHGQWLIFGQAMHMLWQVAQWQMDRIGNIALAPLIVAAHIHYRHTLML